MSAAGWVAAGVVLSLAAALGSVRTGRRRARVARRLATASVDLFHRPTPGRAPVLIPPAVVVRRLRAAAVPMAAERVWVLWLATLTLSVPTAVLTGGPGLGLAAAILVVGGPLLAGWAFGDRADRRIESALPEVLESVAAGLRSGGSLRQAVEEAADAAVGGVRTDLSVLRARLARGEPLVDTLDAWAVDRPLPGVRLAVAALALGSETGGAHARAVDGVAATIRSRSAVTAEVRALSSQARLSGLVIVLAPVAFGAVAALSDGRTAEFLFRTPVGIGCLTAGLALDAVAAVWMHRLSEVDR